MDVKFLHSILDITATEWNGLFSTDYPFTQHTFLSALETSGCTQASTGWEPQHILVYDDLQLIAAAPCYLKSHSYGEYVFDWAWANAYQRHGLDYYPKLISAIPFTPATGPRLAFNANIQTTKEKSNIVSAIDQAIRDKFTARKISSWHVLFPERELSTTLQKSHWQQRHAIQYHWFNKNYSSFENFLDTFKSRKRKSVRKERQAVTKQGITIEAISGKNISDQHIVEFYRFYHSTYLKRSGQHGYLNLKFFQLLLKNMRNNLVMICATKDSTLIATALCFKDNKTLYGRYWGCEQEYDFLHFEACYYHGIEFCIQHGLQRFDPGAQGEHKIPRGFEPIETYSNHVILNADFRNAIHGFLADEKTQVKAYLEHLKTLLPFKLDIT
ncbi:MAG: GNAT family N-acetyltransferase [Cycloclasticus sp.]|nr:MAG: GNAT family N-acetyltransferase [Cycloclasticus sp.]